jgi:hypothetical protein
LHTGRSSGLAAETGDQLGVAGEVVVEKFHGHVVLATDKAFQGYPLDMLAGGDGR